MYRDQPTHPPNIAGSLLLVNKAGDRSITPAYAIRHSTPGTAGTHPTTADNRMVAMATGKLIMRDTLGW